MKQRQHIFQSLTIEVVTVLLVHIPEHTRSLSGSL